MKCFDETSFSVFEVEGLDNRMTVIRSEIQPIFSDIMSEVATRLTDYTGQETFVHIAQHRRRSKYAPESTWSAISNNKRGYKSQPHLQLGIWADYVFMYISIIDNPVNKQNYAAYLADYHEFPDDFVYSIDHTQPEYYSVSADVLNAITRLHDVKKGEFEVGRVIRKDSELWQRGAKAYIMDTFEMLFPIYQQLNQTTN